MVDADTGFGNAQNVQRTVRGFAAAGAACLMLEDQEAPKRDVGAPGAVVPRDDAPRRVTAAVRAREAGADVLVIGRTDARNAAGPASGLEEALWRARAFADLGADLVFVTGPHDERELARVRAAARVPQLVQVDEPGRAPLSPARVHALGFEVALYGITLVLAAAAAFRDALAAMAAGRPLPPERAATFGEIGDIVGVADYLAVERDLAR
jgi:2-methylisocitrate lyase-like PEP mutase family enzyme